MFHKISLVSLVFVTSVTCAQSMRPQLDIAAPDDVTGQPVIYTKRTVGNVIAIGEAVYDSIPVERICQNKSGQEERSVINLGTVAGVVGGAVVGNQFGQGDGKTAMTILGGAAGGFAGNKQTDSGHRA